jgi:hypothetical protein
VRYEIRVISGQNARLFGATDDSEEANRLLEEAADMGLTVSKRTNPPCPAPSSRAGSKKLRSI